MDQKWQAERFSSGICLRVAERFYLAVLSAMFVGAPRCEGQTWLGAWPLAHQEVGSCQPRPFLKVASGYPLVI